MYILYYGVRSDKMGEIQLRRELCANNKKKQQHEEGIN